MAIKILKEKPVSATKAKEATKQASASLIEPTQVDEYIEKQKQLTKKMAALAPLQKELAALEAGFIAVADESVPADQKVELHGNIDGNVIELSPKGNSTRITDRDKLIELIGMDNFLAIATIGLTEAKKYLTEKQFESISVTERTSKRRLKVVAD